MAKKKQRKDKSERPNAPAAKLSRKEFEKELYKLQVEFTRPGPWPLVIVVFEIASKGGVISRMSARTSPSANVALPAPSDREKSRMMAVGQESELFTLVFVWQPPHEQ